MPASEVPSHGQLTNRSSQQLVPTPVCHAWQGLCSLQLQHYSYLRASKKPVLLRDITPVIWCDMFVAGPPTELSPRSSRMSILVFQGAFTSRYERVAAAPTAPADLRRPPTATAEELSEG